MKYVILLIAFLSVSSSAVVGQSGHAGQEKNLRGLKGLRLVVMFARADAIDEAERPAILKLVEADATAKFETPAYRCFALLTKLKTPALLSLSSISHWTNRTVLYIRS
jgi:hypothetical protein